MVVGTKDTCYGDTLFSILSISLCEDLDKNKLDAQMYLLNLSHFINYVFCFLCQLVAKTIVVRDRGHLNTSQDDPCPPRIQLQTLWLGLILTGKMTFLRAKCLENVFFCDMDPLQTPLECDICHTFFLRLP